VPKTVVITQSNYIPWRGYFDLLRLADEVVLLESVQFTRRDWRNRNRIKTAQGAKWLSIPVEVSGRYLQAIDETRIADSTWAEAHRRAIEPAYRNAACYGDVAPWLFDLMREAAAEIMLSAVNARLIRAICERLGINAKISRDAAVVGRERLREMEANQRLLALAKALGATLYLSGPMAHAYLDIEQFRREGIEVEWMSYDGYPDYPQLWGTFEPHVSIIDLLLNTGADAPRYLRKS
jgi:hypothetical protein